MQNDKVMINVLVSYNADLLVKDSQGQTPVDYAVAKSLKMELARLIADQKFKKLANWSKKQKTFK